jgi:nucleosome binding factor SPN SPT16 subunit
MNKNLKSKDPDFRKNLIKYLLFGLIVGMSVRYIPVNNIKNKEIIMIGAIASISFGIIDMVSPSIIIV